MGETKEPVLTGLSESGQPVVSFVTLIQPLPLKNILCVSGQLCVPCCDQPAENVRVVGESKDSAHE